uniref:Reverse transcriptase domain-containing protein n=1 Tax=Tanacetum cinerariifolium TaxID=118510 RepID=A0A6L2LLN3_TANCI|nr:reverse transcriptase domain-containing protein [Tanacetum cinerariifolium]
MAKSLASHISSNGRSQFGAIKIGASVKEYQEKNKIGLKPDKNRKRIRRVVPKNCNPKGERFLIASRFPTPPLACLFFSQRATVKSSSKLSRDQTSNPTSTTNPTLKGRIRRSLKQKLENSNFEENLLPPEVPMAENQTMAQLLQAPTDGYEDAIVIPEIAANNFELKHGLINLIQNKQFLGHEKEDPHAHLRYFNKITSTMRDKYIGDILKKFGFSDVRSSNTPMDKENPWGKDGTGKDVDLHLYRSIIGSLMYLTASRPDIMFAVSFSDSDYGGASQDRKSTTGGSQFLGRRLISWQCKKQTIVATSTTEAEYVTAASCCGKVLWIQNQLLDYGAKSLMEAIEKRFGGNKETKKVQKTLLKQPYKNFTGLSFECLDQIHDRLHKLISQLEILVQTSRSGISYLLAVATIFTGSGNLYCQWELLTWQVMPRNVNLINIRNPTPARGACYEYESTDHLKPTCPRLNRSQGMGGNRQNQVVANKEGQDHGNQGNQARGRAFMLGAHKARQDPKIMTGTFTLNNHFATTLFDSGADNSFVFTTFIPLLGIEPSELGFRYEIEITSRQLLEIDKVIKGCKLKIEGHVFDIHLIPFGHGSFDVIIGMDWLSNHKVKLICYEKVVMIQLLDNKLLRVLGERPKEKVRLLMSAKASDKKQEEIVMVRYFPEDEEQELAFQTLKDKLCNVPVLALLDGREDFVEAVDESAGLQKGLDKMIEQRSDGTLFYLDRVWVPLKGDVRTLIMYEAHKSKYFVHPRVDKMYFDLRVRYWWLGMEKDIAVYFI